MNLAPELRLFFPASKFLVENLQLGLSKLEQLGLTVRHHVVPEPHRFYCGSLKVRAESLISVLNEPGPAMIMAARGGYGCAELLPLLEQRDIDWSNKILIGFSDITAIHAHLSNRNIASLHGPMAATMDWIQASELEVKSFLDNIRDTSENALDLQGTPRQHSGRLVGGNLTVLASLMGTPHQLQLQPGDILFLEDIGEPEYRINRSLNQLSHSPNFKTCHLIWGHLTNCGVEKENVEPFIEQIMEAHSNPWNYGLQAGHERPNMTLRLGKTASLAGNKLIF